MFLRLPGALFALLAAPLGCGASIQAIYEADVRFEHCMAMDAQPEVKPAIRRGCWLEWVSFYTYGQTRDRVLHAQLRIRELNGEEGDVGDKSSSGEVSARPFAFGKSQAALADGRRNACRSECRTVEAECRLACEEPDAASSCRPGCEAGLRACHQQCQ